MATGRTLSRWMRTYIDGYDLSGYTRKVGPLSYVFESADLTAPQSDAVKGVLPNTPSVGAGTMNAIFDSTATTGLLALMAAGGVARKVMLPIGIRAAPAFGNPAFCGVFEQLTFNPHDEGGAMVVDINFGDWNAASLVNQCNPFGWTLHPWGAETGANTAVGFNDVDVATTTKGCWIMWQIFASNAAGSCTITAQDAAVNADGSFALIAGCTSGSIGFASIPTAGIAVSTTVDIRKYLRWQLALAGGMTTVTFALALMRG